MGKMRINDAGLLAPPDGKTVATMHATGQNDPALGPGYGPGNPPIRTNRCGDMPHRVLTGRYEAGVNRN